MSRPFLMLCRAMLLLFVAVARLDGALVPSQVLVVYHQVPGAPDSDGLQIWQHYQNARPGVRGFNLYDGGVLALPSPGTISYTQFSNLIRDPLRAYLDGENLEQTVRVIVLTKGIPHRIQDLSSNANVGDQPNAALSLVLGDSATYASVDSELTLLWHDLDTGGTGEALDRHADNFVLNPYFGKTDSIATFSTANIRDSSLTFTPETVSGSPDWHYWSIPNQPGKLYLTARLDGDTVGDVKRMIDRAAAVTLSSAQDAIVLDENVPPSPPSTPFDGGNEGDGVTTIPGDYEATRDLLLSQSWAHVMHDRTAIFYVGSHMGDFLGGATNPQAVHLPVWLLASYGANHGGISKIGWETTYGRNLVNGAIFNTYESFNGRKLNGVGGWGNHGQVAQWVANGGTFALGHAWEPLTLAVGKNEHLVNAFVNNQLAWVESAWSSIEVVSWQNVVIGDPLATASIVSTVPEIAIQIGDSQTASFYEDEAPHVIVTLTLDIPSPDPLSIRLLFEGATLGGDFTSSSNIAGNEAMVLLPANETQITFSVDVMDDVLPEGAETLAIQVLPPLGEGGAYRPKSTQNQVQLTIADRYYELWQYAHFGSANDLSGEGQDPDNDHLSNLWEYALSKDPKTANEPNDILSQVEAFVHGETLTFTIPKAIPEDIVMSLRTTTDLKNGPWATLLSRSGNAPWAATDASFAVDTEQALTDTISVMMPSESRCFLHFKVARLPDVPE